MDELYLKIAQIFNDNQQVFIDRGLPHVRQCDIYMGQPDDAQSFELFLPAVFVDWAVTAGVDGEEDLLQVDFHVLQEPGTGSENFSERLIESVEYLKVLATVKYLMNRLSSTNTTSLTYTGERPRITPFFKYHIASYKCSIISDDSSINRPNYTDTVPDKLVLTNNIRQKTDTPPTPIIETFK